MKTETKQKLRKHFFFVTSDRKYSRTYGGSDYTVNVYENQGRGRFKRLGDRTACTRAHKGEASEAWSVVWNSQALGRLKREIMTHPRFAESGSQFASYYTYQMQDLFGVKLEEMGGA